jgi:predicted amidophosphoribosyltransferase
MAGVVDAQGLEAVTWIPTTAARRRRRGFDQGQLLARALALRLGLPCVRLLRRLPGPAQTGRSLAERQAGPRLAVSRAAVPASVLVVDDVVTSGATLSAAAVALRSLGAKRVDAVAAASTPLKPSPGVVEAKVNGTNRR